MSHGFIFIKTDFIFFLLIYEGHVKTVLETIYHATFQMSFMYRFYCFNLVLDADFLSLYFENNIACIKL